MYSSNEPDEPVLRPRHQSSFVSAISSSHGPPLMGMILSLPCTEIAKLAARLGFQWIMIDMEHSPFTPKEATELVHTIVASSQGKCFPLIRIPSTSVEWVKWALDSGAAGIIIPMIHNAQMAKDVVDKALYPPTGSRSFGPYNAPWGDALSVTTQFGEYYEKAKNRNVAIIPIIESREGVRNAREIMSVDGITGIFIGPYDLRLSMGLSGGSDGQEPEFTKAVEDICSLGKELGKPIGSMGASTSLSQKRAQQGMRFLLVSFDRTAIVKGLKTDLDAVAKGMDQVTNIEPSL